MSKWNLHVHVHIIFSSKYEDNESEYSYTRSLPGSGKDVTTAEQSSKSFERRLEKERKKFDRKLERERRKDEKRRDAEEKLNHIYDRQIEPVAYNNGAYTPDHVADPPKFIPPPPPPPQTNGSPVVYSKPAKGKKSKKQKQNEAIANGGSVPYGYFEKVVDSEFGFINEEAYKNGVDMTY